MSDFTGMTELITATSALISLLVTVILIIVIARFFYLHRARIIEYIRNQNLRLSKVGVNSVLNFEFIPVETEYGEMSLATGIESYKKPIKGISSTINYFDPNYGFKISWREDKWLGCFKEDGKVGCKNYTERLERELPLMNTEFKEYRVPILIRRVKGVNEKTKYEEDDPKANFIEYVFILVKNLSIDYCIKKPDADDYSKLKKDMGKLNNVMVKPKKDIYDYLNEMPVKNNVSFNNITIDNVEPRCTAFLEQDPDW
jgi:hypothetical protein